MRLLFVSHDFLPRHSAGTEIYTWQLAKALQRRGHEVAVFTTDKDIARPDRTVVRRSFDGLDVVELTNNLFYEDFEETYDWAPAVQALRQELDAFRPDVVHGMHLLYLSIGCAEAVHGRGIPFLYTMHDFWLQCARFGQRVHADGSVCHTIEPERCGTCLARVKFAQTPAQRRNAKAIAQVRAATGIDLAAPAKWVARRMQRPPGGYEAPRPEEARRFEQAMRRREEAMRDRLVPVVDGFLAPSRFLLEAFRTWGIPEAKLHHVPYGIDLAPFQDSVAPADKPARLRVRFLGTVAPHKGVHVLLEAWGKLDASVRAGAELVLHGSRAHFPEYVDRCARLEQSVGARDGGLVRREDVPALLAETDLLVVPSVWYENSPLVIHEAQAARTPLVVSDFGGMAELVAEERDGWRFRVGDAAHLAEVLGRVLSDPARLRALPFDGHRPRSIDEAAEEMEARYETLLAQRTGGAT